MGQATSLQRSRHVLADRLETLDCPFARYSLGVSDRAIEQALHDLRTTMTTHRKGALLGRYGDPCKDILILQHGWAMRFRVAPDGRRQIFSILLAGDPLAPLALPDGRHDYSVMTLTDVALCHFAPATFGDYVLAHPALSKRLDSYRARVFAAASERVTDLAVRSALQRVARFALDLHERLARRGMAEDRVYEHPLTQAHMGDLLGLTAVHVSRVVTELNASGAIQFEPHKVTIKDFDLLADLAAIEPAPPGRSAISNSVLRR